MAFLHVALCLALLACASGCGVPAIQPNLGNLQRIINGEDAVPGSWPWQVSLQTNSGFHFCGGSLISPTWVVTAAHCQVRAGYHFVVLGEYNRNSGAEPIQVRSIAKAITHPYWNPNNMNNDITLLKLSSPAQLGPWVSPVCLATASESLPAGLTCVTTGWGRTNSNTNEGAILLQQVALPLVTVSQCQQYWGNRITSSMICAGGAGASSCQGDSGGPLVCLKRGAWTLIGIVSWGNSYCNIKTPAIYARVSVFRSWIDSVVASN